MLAAPVSNSSHIENGKDTSQPEIVQVVGDATQTRATRTAQVQHRTGQCSAGQCSVCTQQQSAAECSAVKHRRAAAAARFTAAEQGTRLNRRQRPDEPTANPGPEGRAGRLLLLLLLSLPPPLPPPPRRPTRAPGAEAARGTGHNGGTCGQHCMHRPAPPCTTRDSAGGPTSCGRRSAACSCPCHVLPCSAAFCRVLPRSAPRSAAFCAVFCRTPPSAPCTAALRAAFCRVSLPPEQPRGA